MRFDEQFYIGKVTVWHAEVDGKPIQDTNHPKRGIFLRTIQNKLHAEQLIEHFGLVTVDLREDWNYSIFDQRGIGVGSMYDRFDHHRVVKPPPFPRDLRGNGLFRYLCDAEKVLAKLREHFKYLVDYYLKMPAEMRAEFSNLIGEICPDMERMKALTIGLHEKPRRRTSLSQFLDDHPD